MTTFGAFGWARRYSPITPSTSLTSLSVPARRVALFGTRWSTGSHVTQSGPATGRRTPFTSRPLCGTPTARESRHAIAGLSGRCAAGSAAGLLGGRQLPQPRPRAGRATVSGPPPAAPPERMEPGEPPARGSGFAASIARSAGPTADAVTSTVTLGRKRVASRRLPRWAGSPPVYRGGARRRPGRQADARQRHRPAADAGQERLWRHRRTHGPRDLPEPLDLVRIEPRLTVAPDRPTPSPRPSAHAKMVPHGVKRLPAEA